MNKTSKIILGVIILLVVAGGFFYGGMIYGKSQNKSSLSAGNFQGFRGNRTESSGGGASIIAGSIISKDNSSITIQLTGTSGSKIIFYSGTTQISKFASGTASDLATGTSVNVAGTTNSDGSVTAQSIQIRPNRPPTGQ